MSYHTKYWYIELFRCLTIKIIDLFLKFLKYAIFCEFKSIAILSSYTAKINYDFPTIILDQEFCIRYQVPQIFCTSVTYFECTVYLHILLLLFIFRYYLLNHSLFILCLNIKNNFINILLIPQFLKFLNKSGPSIFS
jgi:hypothetical protein